jgi:hypothetical protein
MVIIRFFLEMTAARSRNRPRRFRKAYKHVRAFNVCNVNLCTRQCVGFVLFGYIQPAACCQHGLLGVGSGAGIFRRGNNRYLSVLTTLQTPKLPFDLPPLIFRARMIWKLPPWRIVCRERQVHDRERLIEAFQVLSEKALIGVLLRHRLHISDIWQFVGRVPLPIFAEGLALISVSFVRHFSQNSQFVL